MLGQGSYTVAWHHPFLTKQICHLPQPAWRGSWPSNGSMHLGDPKAQIQGQMWACRQGKGVDVCTLPLILSQALLLPTPSHLSCLNSSLALFQVISKGPLQRDYTKHKPSLAIPPFKKLSSTALQIKFEHLSKAHKIWPTHLYLLFNLLGERPSSPRGLKTPFHFHRFWFCFVLFFLIFIYLAVPGLSCGVFSCSIWNLVSRLGSNPGPLHWEHGVLATGPAGESLLPTLEYSHKVPSSKVFSNPSKQVDGTWSTINYYCLYHGVSQ